jgi:2-oxoisovalerate dehydrogenase E2 component (dihydrolipoyl transacylase)
VIRPSPTRLTIARNMLRTAQTVPAAWMVVEVDVTGLVRLRERQREAFRAREGVDLTYLPFMIQATVAALREQPLLNAEWRDDHIVLKKRINLGVAVGVEEGLIVPVIRDADRLSIAGLAYAVNDLAQRARAKKLRIEDVTGGTFTLDNTGVFGSLVSQPIINPPQAAILSTEAIVKRPVVLDDAIAVRSIMNLCITFDHRIVDGSHVGPFMQSIKRRLEAYAPDTPIA